MVGGLIQKKKVWLHEQGTRQTDAHAPTSGEGGGRLVLHFRGESQTGEDAASTGLRFVDTMNVDLVEHFVIFFQLAMKEKK